VPAGTARSGLTHQGVRSTIRSALKQTLVQQATQRTRVSLFAGAPKVIPGGASPFLKWAGGKSELLPELAKRLPRSFNTYWEPFLGGGALFFYLNPMSAVLSDLNEEVINCYQAVKTSVEQLIEELKKYRNDRKHFQQVRKVQPWELEPVQRAARLIYLNKTCYNGLYRVNRRGEFNVPFGRYDNPRICDESGLRAASKALQGAEILCRDFRFVLYRAHPGDFIYFDPPYKPISSTSSFTSYSEAPFEEREQNALKEVFSALNDRGCFAMLSNSATDHIRRLYRDFHIDAVLASRAINSRGDKRGKISELIITNY
jgi:DNA adenine methylase